MYNEYKKDIDNEYRAHVNSFMCNKRVSTEVGCDVLLPDYQPELRRLLGVTVKVMPPAKYVSPAGVECNGNIEVRITYVGVDGEMYAASAVTEYDVNLPSDADLGYELSLGAVTYVNTVCEGTNAKINGGRRVNVRARLRTSVICCAPLAAEGDLYGEVDASTVERLYGETENLVLCAESSDAIELSDEIGGLSVTDRVVLADTAVNVTDIRCGDGFAKASGEVELRLTVCSEDKKIRTVSKKLHFEGGVENGELDGECGCLAVGNVTDLTVNVEDGKATCTALLIIELVGAKKRLWSYTKDVYSTERECGCETFEIDVPRALVCKNGSFSQNERVSVADKGLPEGAVVADHTAEVIFDDCEVLDGKLTLVGNTKYNVICEIDGEYSSFELSFPVRYHVDMGGYTGKGISFDAAGSVISRRLRLEGDVLAIDAEIGVSCFASCSDCITVAKAVRFGDKFPKGAYRMVESS